MRTPKRKISACIENELHLQMENDVSKKMYKNISEAINNHIKHYYRMKKTFVIDDEDLIFILNFLDFSKVQIETKKQLFKMYFSSMEDRQVDFLFYSLNETCSAEQTVKTYKEMINANKQ